MLINVPFHQLRVEILQSLDQSWMTEPAGVLIELWVGCRNIPQGLGDKGRTGGIIRKSLAEIQRLVL